MNELVADITELFTQSGVNNFEETPDDVEAAQNFPKQFKILKSNLEQLEYKAFIGVSPVYTFSEDVPEDENGSEHECDSH